MHTLILSKMVRVDSWESGFLFTRLHMTLWRQRLLMATACRYRAGVSPKQEVAPNKLKHLFVSGSAIPLHSSALKYSDLQIVNNAGLFKITYLVFKLRNMFCTNKVKLS